MNIFKELRTKKNLTQLELAQVLNINQATVSKWEQAKSIPDVMMLKTLSEFYSVPIELLLNGEKRDLNFNKKINRIPVLGKIPAGTPLEMIEDVLDYEEINPDMLRGGKEYFALKVKGESMSPKFLEGDILIVRKQSTCENGEYAIVAVNGYDATFKKIIKKENCIILQPLNSSYEPMIYTNEDIEKLPVKILGVVVEIRRSI